MKQQTVDEHEKAINKVIDYINSHLYEMPAIRELAEVANISGFHLHRVFKAIIGENIGEFVIRLRLEDIALRLLMSDVSLTDIALDTGYGTKHALSKAFKNYFGVSPSIYRKSSKNIHPFFGNNDYKNLNLTPEIKYVQEKKVVYIRIIDVYGAEESFRRAWHKLGTFAKENNLLHPAIEFIGLSFDDPTITHPTRCRFYACFTPDRDVKPQGAFGIKVIPAGGYAMFLHRGSYSKLKEMYYNIYINWAANTNYKIKGSLSFERYLNSPSDVDEVDLLTEIYVPVTK